MEATLPVLTIERTENVCVRPSVAQHCCMPVTWPGLTLLYTSGFAWYDMVVHHLPVTLSGLTPLYSSDFVRFNTAVCQ